MEVIIKTCPSCQQLLLDDSGVCPGCGHDLAPGMAQPLPLEPLSSDRTSSESSDIPCRRCGSMVHRALVRCPQCGTLTQPERYGKRNPAGPHSAVDSASAGSVAQVSRAQLADNDDFEMSDVQIVEDSHLLQDLASRTGYGPMDNSADGGDDFDLSSGVTLVSDPNPEQSNYHLVEPAGLAEIGDDQSGWQQGEQATYDQGYQDEGSGEYALPGTEGGVPPVYDDPNAGGGELPPDDGWSGEAPPAAGETGYADEAPPVDEAPPLSPEDALYAAALQEEAEAGRRPKNRRRRQLQLKADAFLVYCPNGHKIVVREQHRGRLGRCPNCKQPFFVPAESLQQDLPQGAGEAAIGSEAIGQYTDWIVGARMNLLNPTKLKLKESSLVGSHDVVDIGFAPDHLLLGIVFPGNTGFRSMVEAKKTEANRQLLRDHLAASGALDQAPTKLIRATPDQLTSLRIAQPPIPGDESIFAGVPVFGPGRIAIRFAPGDTAAERCYLSLTLSQYRVFAQRVREQFGVESMSPVPVVPLTDEYENVTCHYSDTALRGLLHTEFYIHDPALKLQLVGWKCASCGLVVSEDSRKKEKIGGKAESSVAKAKCPKCRQRFGDVRLLGLAPSSA